MACALRWTREWVEDVVSVLGRLEWFDRAGDVGVGRENC